MREVVKVGNSTLIFNTDYVNPEEKALMLKEIAELDIRNRVEKELKARQMKG